MGCEARIAGPLLAAWAIVAHGAAAAAPGERTYGRACQYTREVYENLIPFDTNPFSRIAVCDLAYLAGQCKGTAQAAFKAISGLPPASIWFAADTVRPEAFTVSFVFPRPPAVDSFNVSMKDPFAGKMGEPLDSMIMPMILEEARTHDHKHDPSMRNDLIWVISTTPFTANAESAFDWLADGFPGRSDNERVTNSVAWAQDYQRGQYLPDVLSGAAYHFYRKANYNEAVSYVDRYLDKSRANADRLLILKAMCLSQKNDGQAARAVLEAVEKEYAGSALVPQVVFLRGWTYLNEQKTAEAKTIFEDLTARYPNDPFSQKAKRILESLKK